jgi:hypothetical protein
VGFFVSGALSFFWLGYMLDQVQIREQRAESREQREESREERGKRR